MQRSLVAMLALVGIMASGCAGPRIVRSMSSTREGKFRILYDRNAGFGNYEQGLIDCDAAEGGAISNCKPVKVTFKE
jgi:hypothetical protein